MEKLIQLLNEYEAERHKTSIVAEIWWQNGDRLTYLGLNNHYSELLCISKGYLFIQRLVENKKIDFESQAMQYVKSDLSKFFTEWKDKNGMSDDYAMLLMLLSIQDNPIEFLISILK